MKKMSLFLICFVAFFSMVTTGCTNSTGTPEDTINLFVEKYYVVDRSDLKMYESYYTGNHIPSKELTNDINSFNDVLTTTAFENFKSDRLDTYRFHILYLNNSTSEFQNLNIKEIKEEDGMKCFNFSLKWIIKNEDGEIIKEFDINRNLYLSDDHGSWLINEFNTFDVLCENLILTRW